MLNGALTNGQFHKLKNWFIEPYITMLEDALEEIAPKALAPLVQLVTSPHLSATQLRLLIGEGVAENDDDLKLQIQNILPKAGKDQINDVYNILYKMLHEMRLNKDPDSPFADDHNAVMIEQNDEPGSLYERAYHKTKTLAFRLGSDGPIPSGVEMEEGFLAVVRDVMLDKMKKMPVQDEIEINESKDEDFELQAAIELSKQQPTFFIQFDDEFLARKLQAEEEELYAKKLLQEEEDYRYARRLLINSH